MGDLDDAHLVEHAGTKAGGIARDGGVDDLGVCRKRVDTAAAETRRVPVDRRPLDDQVTHGSVLDTAAELGAVLGNAGLADDRVSAMIVDAATVVHGLVEGH